MSSTPAKLLMVGLDAGDELFIRRHLSELPNIERFFADAPVRKLAAEPLSGAVWSSFATRSKPDSHGVYHHLQWNPQRMRIERTHPDWVGDLVPFWRSMAKAGKRIIALDVPFVFQGECDGALEIMNWGSHDLVDDFWCSDASVAAHIRQRYGEHPMGFEVPVRKSLKKLSRDRDTMIDGVALRAALTVDLMNSRDWDLFVVVFGETHRAGHLLQPTDEDFAVMPTDAMLDVYRAADRAFGEICAAADDHCDIVLFSLHGMAPNYSQSHLSAQMIDDILRDGEQEREQAVRKPGFIRWLRETTPASVQHKIADFAPRAVRDFVVSREIGGGVARGETKAFSLNGDLCGYWRLLTSGREAVGALNEADAAALAHRAGEALLKYETPDGRRLVKNITFPAMELSGARAHLLPDILAEWNSDLAPAEKAVHPHYATVTGEIATGRGGNHRMEGFFAHRGPHRDGGAPPNHISDLADLADAVFAD